MIDRNLCVDRGILMPARPPVDPAAQLQWLVDRAEITGLFQAFARAIDEKDQP